MNKFKILSIFSIIFFACKSSHPNLDISKGKELYKNKCSSCHNYQKSSSEYYPSLHEMIKMDSVVLERKLNVSLKDSLHKHATNLQDKKDIENIKFFLTTYDGIEP